MTQSNKLSIKRIQTRSVPSRVIGWVLAAVGFIVLVWNWVEEFSDALPLLPGGHSPFYFAGSIVAIAVGVWRVGVFDAK